MRDRPVTRQPIAVIGSGVAGLTAAHLLQQDHDVTLFEADSRLGGHAHTHEHISAGTGSIRVDSGFIVHNRVTYPNLLRLFERLGVSTEPTSMSMSVRCEGCGLEYAGALGLRGLFARPRSAVSPAFWRMLLEVHRFHRQARAVLAGQDPSSGLTTLGGFLEAGGYSAYFVSHFMIPVVSAVWSTAPRTALLYPARYLFSFLEHHGMLSVRGSHQWYTVSGGSRTYVEAIAAGLSAVRLSTPVDSLIRRGDGSGVEIVTSSGTETFRRVVVATHPDTALRFLADASPSEKDVLGAFRYSRNETVLHQDDGVLPVRPAARAAWNYLLPACGQGVDRDAEQVVVSYDMNRLQHLPGPDPYVVTLNATDLIDPDRVLARMVYDHPIYTPQSVEAQARLPELNTDVTAFAGAYHGWGFHEDGCRAGVAAAARFGAAW